MAVSYFHRCAGLLALSLLVLPPDCLAQTTRSPDVARSGDGRMVSVWSTVLPPGGPDADVLQASSINGVDWTDPAPLPGLESDAGADETPRIAFGRDGAGNALWVAVWSTNAAPGSLAPDRDIVFSTSSDGLSWGTPSSVPGSATDAGSDTDAAIAFGRDGFGASLWVMVWSSNDTSAGLGADRDIMFSTSTNGSTWTAPARLPGSATDAGSDSDPEIAFGKDATSSDLWMVVWSSDSDAAGSGPDRDILFSTSTNGSTWTTRSPVHLSNSGSDKNPHVCSGTDALGNPLWLVAWESDQDMGGFGSDFDIRVARSTDGATWSVATPTADAATDSGSDRRPRLSHGIDQMGSGRWLLVWSRNDVVSGFGPDEDIAYMTSIDGATWSTAMPPYIDSQASSDVARDGMPAVTSLTSSGRASVIWVVTGDYGESRLYTSTTTNYGTTWSSVIPLLGSIASPVTLFGGVVRMVLAGSIGLLAFTLMAVRRKSSSENWRSEQ